MLTQLLPFEINWPAVGAFAETLASKAIWVAVIVLAITIVAGLFARAMALARERKAGVPSSDG